MKQSTTSTSNLNFQLKHLSIQPIHQQPILIIENHRILKIVVDSVQTKHNNLIKMLFIATEHNTILKYMVLNMKSINQENNKAILPTTCLYEEIEITDRTVPMNSINNLVLLSKPNSRNLLIATSSNLIHMPVANCEVQSNYFGCLSLMNPYCLWNSKSQECIYVFRITTNEDSQDSQTVAKNIMVAISLIIIIYLKKVSIKIALVFSNLAFSNKFLA